MKTDKKINLICLSVIFWCSLGLLLEFTLTNNSESSSMFLQISFYSYILNQLLALILNALQFSYERSTPIYKLILSNLIYFSDYFVPEQQKNYYNDSSSNHQVFLAQTTSMINFICLAMQVGWQIIWLSFPHCSRLHIFFILIVELSCIVVIVKQSFLERMKKQVRKFFFLTLLLSDCIEWAVFICTILSVPNLVQTLFLILPSLTFELVFYRSYRTEFELSFVNVIVQGMFSIFPTQILTVKEKLINVKTQEASQEAVLQKKKQLFIFSLKAFQKILQFTLYIFTNNLLLSVLTFVFVLNEPFLLGIKHILSKKRKVLVVSEATTLKDYNRDSLFFSKQLKKYTDVQLQIPYQRENQYETIISLLFSFSNQQIKDNYQNSKVQDSSCKHPTYNVTISNPCNKNYTIYFYLKLISSQKIFVKKDINSWLDVMSFLVTKLNINILPSINSVYLSALTSIKSITEHCQFFSLFNHQVRLLNLPQQVQGIHDNFYFTNKGMCLQNIIFNKLIANSQITNPNIIFYTLYEDILF